MKQKPVNWRSRFIIGLFPILTVLLLIPAAVQNQEAIANPEGALKTYLHNAQQGNIGFGLAGFYNNQMSFEGLEPGDLVLGGYPDCAYGRFSHAAIYLGNDQVAEAYAEVGVLISPVQHFHSYSQVCLLKVNAAPEIKQKAVEYIMSKRGALFYPIAFKPGDRIWNCTKIMWKAYAVQGVDLDSGNDIWVTPDSFYRSSWVTVIREL
jgi:hypothetical protein